MQGDLFHLSGEGVAFLETPTVCLEYKLDYDLYECGWATAL